MALAINIEDPLNKQKIESNRIEFKKGWNPVGNIQYICFTNDNNLSNGCVLTN